MTERRQQAQRRVKSTPVTVTIDKELMEFLDVVLERRAFRSRSHAVNAALDYLKWTLENEPTRFFGPRAVQPSKTPQPPIPQNRGRQPPR
jgi:hypothetical protein